MPPPPVTNPLGPALTDQPPPNFGQQPPGTPSEGLPLVPLTDFVSPPRPNVGSEGRTIPLRANHFQVRVPKGIIHHYEVSISPDKCPRRVNRWVCASWCPIVVVFMFFFFPQSLDWVALKYCLIPLCWKVSKYHHQHLPFLYFLVDLLVLVSYLAFIPHFKGVKLKTCWVFVSRSLL